ncbi:hypothetical protein PIB30_067762 [Stylosanthes scabra]|uniref:Uncharacterized protein n=1 Tax=Stylosanthes scabra TaxID=79078 RepID=A0ABU6ULH2_9FABA|nr:hypothetical protein [Stylosanthes scabra]
MGRVLWLREMEAKLEFLDLGKWGSKGPGSVRPPGSPVSERFADFQFHILNRAKKVASSRSDRPIRSGFQNLGKNRRIEI